LLFFCRGTQGLSYKKPPNKGLQPTIGAVSFGFLPVPAARRSRLRPRPLCRQSNVMDYNVSPKFKNNKLQNASISDKIDVFEDQMTGWLFAHHARALCSDKYTGQDQAGFAVVSLLSPYFEATESYHVGLESKGRSKEFFRKGFLRVFYDFAASLKKANYPAPDQLAEELVNNIYEEMRCGLAHEALTKSRVILRSDTAPLGLMIETSTGALGSIIIDPAKFLDSVEGHFQEHVKLLRNPTEVQLRANFEKFFDLRISRPSAIPPPPAVVDSAHPTA
jgi:hypothetical protein